MFKKKQTKYIFPPFQQNQIPEPRLPDPGWPVDSDPMAGPGWDRDTLSWAFPGFGRDELEEIVTDILQSDSVIPDPKERAYLSGPMKGKPLHNFPKFIEVSAILRGFYSLRVVSPHEIQHVGKDLTREDYLRGDLCTMLSYPCDAIVMMDNWLDSWGACFELNVAAKLGFKIYLWDNLSTAPQLHDGERLRYYVR